jgi:hypothetical protein
MPCKITTRDAQSKNQARLTSAVSLALGSTDEGGNSIDRLLHAAWSLSVAALRNRGFAIRLD